MFSFSRKAPFRLKEGLFLESDKSLLPWDASAEILATIGGPQRKDSDREIYLSWLDRTLLGGLAANVIYRSREPNRFTLIATPGAGTSVNERHAFVLGKLRKALGKPHSSTTSKTPFKIYPRDQWHYGKVHVSLAIGEHFDEYVSLIVWRDG